MAEGSLDLTRLPAGEREWSEFIHLAAASGDAIERHFIELKSDVDPTGKSGAAKVAKFILGSAHRDPDQAGKYLGGYAVMLLGVSAGEVRGLARFEAKDIVGAIQQYVGVPGPGWDFLRIRVDDDHDVIVIVVDPPQPGAVWPCCREGVGLNDGRIYIRADGETREAKGDEVRALFERARENPTGQGSPNLTVEFSGAVHRFTCSSSLLDEYIAAKRGPLDSAAPTDAQVKADEATYRMSLGAAQELSRSIGDLWRSTEQPDDRDRDEYLQELDEWEAAVRRAWPRFVTQFAIMISAEDASRIRARSMRYLEDVKIKIRLDSPIQAIEQPSADLDFIDLPEPPRAWGPRKIDSLYGLKGVGPPPMLDIPVITSHLATTPFSRYDHIEIEQSKTALEVLVGELRPDDPYTSGDSVCLWAPSDHEESITGTWTATAKGHHEIYSGDMQIAVEDPFDLTEPLREYLLAPPSDDEDER